MKPTRRRQMLEGDFAVFHGDESSGRVRITSVNEDGYEYVYIPSGVGGAVRRPLDDDRLEPCPTIHGVYEKRHRWLQRHPELKPTRPLKAATT